MLTVRGGLRRWRPRAARRPDPARDLRVAGPGAVLGRRAGPAAAGQPARGFPAPSSPQGRRAGSQPGRGHTPRLPAQPGRGDSPAGLSGPGMGPGADIVPEGRRGSRGRPRTGAVMSTPSPVPDIRGTITLAVPAERAFAVFTDSFGSWWPSEYRIGQAEMADAILEPHAPGGRWYERGTDGSECDWGQVLASEIEVRFTP